MSVIVAPEFRGKGLASEMVRLGTIKAGAPVTAYVQATNKRSVRAFLRAGFTIDDTYVRLES